VITASLKKTIRWGWKETLRRPFLKSFAIHFAIIFALWCSHLITRVFEWSEPKIITPPSLRVDLVALPDQIANRRFTTPATLPVDESSAKPDTTSKKSQAQDEKLAREELDDFLSTTTASKQSGSENKSTKTKDAIARLKALDHIRTLDRESETGPETFKGNRISKGKSISAEAREQLTQGYLDELRDHIALNWELPRWLLKENLSSKIHITIDAEGTPMRKAFLKKSGNSTFDEAVLEALQRATPLPKPSSELKDALSKDGIVLGFPL